MAPDTKSNFIRVWLSVGTVAVAIVGYIININSKAIEAEKVNVRQDVEIRNLSNSNTESLLRMTRMESDVTYIKGGIEDIKQDIRQAIKQQESK